MDWKELMAYLIIAVALVLIASSVSQCAMKDMELRNANDRARIEKGLCQSGWGQWEVCK